MVDKQSPIPYYLQIYNVLKERIDKGIYKANTQMPSENELVEEFDVTRVTIRNTIKKLKDEGRIYTLKAKGSYINAPKIEQSLFNFYSFGRNYASLNIESNVISIKEKVASDDLRKKLALGDADTVNEIIRVRMLEGTPVIVEASYVPIKIAPDIGRFDLKKLSIYNLLEDVYNNRILYAREYLDPSVTDEYYSKLLQVSKGTPVFITERITYTLDEKPIEYRISTIRSDKFRFSVELR